MFQGNISKITHIRTSWINYGFILNGINMTPAVDINKIVELKASMVSAGHRSIIIRPAVISIKSLVVNFNIFIRVYYLSQTY